MSSTAKKKAEQLFREAFERLKGNTPRVLEKGSKVTQNNVAREAGRDPSALKKDRYPLLLLDIQAHIQSKAEESKSKNQSRDSRTRSIKQQLSDSKKQRDKLASIVQAQDGVIESLMDELEKLKAGKVIGQSSQF